MPCSSNLASLKLEARGRLFQNSTSVWAVEGGHPRFSTRASHWHSRVNATSLLHPTSSLRIAPLASHAFVELPRPNVAFELLAITMIDSCHADTHNHPVFQAIGHPSAHHDHHVLHTIVKRNSNRFHNESQKRMAISETSSQTRRNPTRGQSKL